MNRLEVREQVLCCESCELFNKGHGPVPFSGPTPAHVAVVGEAPGKTEDEKGQPFIGPAGSLLREYMTTAGIDPEMVFFANAASCWPDGTPTSDHVNACSRNLETQLELARPRWVLLVGGVALSTLRPDLKVTRARSHVFCPPGRPRFLSTVHPSFALRNRKGEVMLRADLELLVEMIDTLDNSWMDMASNACVICGTGVDEMTEHDMHLRFDDMGASFCNACFERRSSPTKTPRPDVAPAEEVPLFG